MRRHTVAIIAGSSLIALAPLSCSDQAPTSPRALSTTADPARNGNVVVTGSGHLDFFFSDQGWRSFSFHAIADASGAASGRFELHARPADPDLRVHGEVICASSSGNQAWIGGRVTSASDPDYLGIFTSWWVVDNGEGANAPADQISLMQFHGVPNVPLSRCANQSSPLDVFPIDAGNIQIR